MALVAAAAINFQDPNGHRNAIEVAQFGRVLQDVEYARLAGVCVPGTTVSVFFDYDLTGTQFPVGVRARAEDWFSARLFFDRPVVTLDSIFVAQQRRRGGLAREVFYHQAKAVAEFGFTIVRAKALRIPEGDIRGMHDGYRGAARWGFNAQLNEQIRGLLPESLGDATCLHDLMASEAGRMFWEEHGHTVDVEFNLNEGAHHWNVLGETPEPDNENQAPLLEN